MDLLAGVGMLLSLLCIASPLHKPIRQLAKQRLVDITIRQLPWVRACQIYVNRLVDVAVLLSAATITLEVYLTMIPLLIWSGKEFEVTSGLLPQLALAGYVVFAIKDMLESPRPGDCLKAAAPGVTVTVRDPSGDIEDGVPSAHCCGAVSLLYYGIHAAAAAGLLSPQQQTLAQVAAAVWVVWLAWGRAYLGLHSPLDLLTGSLLGWVMVRLWLSVEPHYVAWLLASAHSPAWQLPLQVLLLSAVLMRCYPMPSRWTSCYNYATAWAAGWAGVTVGWALRQHTQWETSTSSEWLFGGMVPPLACKIFLGLGLVAASKVLVKAVLMAVFAQLFKAAPTAVRCWWQPPIVGAVRQPPLQQQGSHWLGYASAVLADLQSGVSPARDAAAGGQQEQQAAVLKAQVSSQLNPKAAAAASSRSGTGTPGPQPRGLRHSPEGIGNDVVVTARWCSYLAVGLTVSLWPVIWPVVLQRLAPSVSVS